MLGDRVEHLAARLAGRESFRIGRKRGELGIPAVRQIAMLDAHQPASDIGIAGPITLEETIPGLPCFLAAPPDAAAKKFVDSVRNQEMRVLRPAVVAFGEPYFLFSERLAV